MMDDRTMTVFSWHGYRAAQTGGAAGIADLQAAHVTHCGCPYQHTEEPYVATLREAGLRIAWTIGLEDRPAARDFGKGHGIAFDCEGGDCQGNAAWFSGLYRKLDWWTQWPKKFEGNDRLICVYSGYPGIFYGGQPIQFRYGCDWGLFHQEFSSGWGWPRPLPVAACGGVRGPLPANALQGMPDVLPVLHGVCPPDYDTPPDTWDQQVRECARDRLAWVRKRPGSGLVLVKAVDGPQGARWGEWDSRICRIVGEEVGRR